MSPVEKTLLWGFGKVAGRNRFLVALLWGARGLPKARPTSVTEEAVDKDCKLGNSGQIEVGGVSNDIYRKLQGLGSWNQAMRVGGAGLGGWV